MDPSVQFWLEIAKLLISLFAPLIAAGIAYMAARFLKRLENAIWATRTVIDKRIQLYDDIGPKLNDVYCYLMYIGSWKEKSPKEIVDLKRSLDRAMHVNRIFFGKRLFDSYQLFMTQCFLEFTGEGVDAAIRSSYEGRQKFYRGEWEEEWFGRFTEEKYTKHQVNEAYNRFLDCFSAEIGVLQRDRAPATDQA